MLILSSAYQNLDQLDSLLQSVSEPSSSKYGQYYDIDQVDAVFAASDKSVDSVTNWLHSSGATDVVNDRGIVRFTTTVGNANSMLDAKFKVYTNGKTTVLRTTKYSVPDDLSQHIDLISPTTYFSGLQAHVAIPRGSPAVDTLAKRQYLQPACLTTIEFQNESFTVLTPSCLKELYNIGDYSADPSSGSDIAFGNFLNQSASYVDLAQYEKTFNIPSQNFTVKALINGGVDNQDPATEMDDEANLDVDNIVALVDGLPIYAYITGGLPPFNPTVLQPNASENQNEPYLEYYQYLLSQPNSNLPYIFSNSYGDEENSVPEYYAKRVCSMIGMMGLRGRSVLEASGDTGTGASCINNMPPYNPQFTPQFPSTCPYVTSVGGTAGYNPEVAWDGSSGGFSNYFPTAWFQQNAVNTYLNQYINPVAKQYYTANSYVNFSGRGFPDVAAHSLHPE